MLILLGIVVMYAPSLWDLFHGIWATDKQGHGPIILAVTLWLFYSKAEALLATSDTPAPAAGWSLLVFSLLLFFLGRTQDIFLFELGSVIPLLIACILLTKGPRTVQAAWFPLFFLLFMVPLPAPVVDALTQPMKTGVSIAAETILHALGYPISRSGVVLQVGQYQLLVADACAGLHTLFTLEALGLLYLNLVRHSSVVRNFTLALLIVPISFSANVIRVMVLTLITYHLGDEAGQGFLHGFAGMVLFGAALLLIISGDAFARAIASRYDRPSRAHPTAHAI